MPLHTLTRHIKLTRGWRRFLRTLLGIYLAIIASGFVLDAFFTFRSSDLETTSWFVQRGQPIHINYYQAEGRTLRYIYTDNRPGKPVILFIHGAPSSSSYYRTYLSNPLLRSQANLIAVDRPGYGYSGLGQPEPNIERQAAMIKPILDSLHSGQRPVLIVGASYGTSIACRMAMDYPHLVDGLMLLAPSLAPGEEKTYWISHVLESPFFTYAQPRMIHSANVEKFAHRAELEKMLPHWSNIKVPVVYMQGAQDELIYTSNAAFARQHLANSSSLQVKMLPGLGHLIAFKAQATILKAMQDLLPKAEAFYANRPDGASHLEARLTATQAAEPNGLNQ